MLAFATLGNEKGELTNNCCASQELVCLASPVLSLVESTGSCFGDVAVFLGRLTRFLVIDAGTYSLPSKPIKLAVDLQKRLLRGGGRRIFAVDLSRGI